AKAADCAVSTVAEAIKALEAVGILSWVNRIARIRERCEDLFGNRGTRWRIIRISNAYHFRDRKARALMVFLLNPNFRQEPRFKSLSLLRRGHPLPRSTPITTFTPP